MAIGSVWGRLQAAGLVVGRRVLVACRAGAIVGEGALWGAWGAWLEFWRWPERAMRRMRVRGHGLVGMV